MWEIRMTNAGWLRSIPIPTGPNRLMSASDLVSPGRVEKLSRATFMPARTSRSSISGESEAGPIVATILVLLAGRRFMI